MTTAEARTQALAAEKACDWGLALVRWNDAIDTYPLMPGRTSHTPCQRADIEKMAARRDGCRAMVNSEAERINTDDINWVGHPIHY